MPPGLHQMVAASPFTPSEYTITANGGPGGDGGDFGPNTPGTTTGGFNEAMLQAQAEGGTPVSLLCNIVAPGQFIFRSGPPFKCNGYSMLCSSAIPNPFITDPLVFMGPGPIYARVGMSGTTNSCTDTVINALGGSSITSPYTYTNSTSYYTVLLVTGGTVSQIQFNGTTVSGYTDGVFSVPPNGTVQVTFSVAPTVTLLGAVMTTLSGGYIGNGSGAYVYSPTNYDLRVVQANAGNAFTLTGGYVPGTSNISWNQISHYQNLIVETNAGLNSFRFIGSGASNHMSCVNTKVDFAQSVNIGHGGTVGYGLNFAIHTDHIRVKQCWLQTASGAGAGTSCIVFNDGVYGGAADSTQKVQSNWVIDAITVCTNSTDYGILSNAAGDSGDGKNIVQTFRSAAGQTTAVSIGGSTSTNPAFLEAYDSIGHNRYFGTTEGLLVQPVNEATGGSAYSFTLGRAFLFSDARSNLVATDSSAETVYTAYTPYEQTPVIIYGSLYLSGSGSGSGTYTITYTDLAGNHTLSCTGSAIGQYIAAGLGQIFWIKKGTSVTAQLTAVGSPAWTCAVSCIVIPL